jgi:hypothetical protein
LVSTGQFFEGGMTIQISVVVVVFVVDVVFVVVLMCVVILVFSTMFTICLAMCYMCLAIVGHVFSRC